MIAGAFLLAAVQAPAAYPSAEVLGAFGTLCRELKDLEQTEAKAKSAGWASFTPDPATPIGQLVEFGASQGKQMMGEQGTITPIRALRRNVAGEDLVAILSGIRMDGAFVNGCRVHDVGETRQISAADGERWVGREPSATNANEAVTMSKWKPGYDPGHDSFEIFFVPAGSPAINLVKVSGVALKADLVGVEE